MDQQPLLHFDNTTPTPSNNINQNLTNVQKNNQNTLTFKGYDFCLTVLGELACLFFCSTVAVLFFIFNIYGGTILFSGWTLSLVVFWVCFYGTSVRKVELIKNECGNQCTLKITKNCGCSKQYTLMPENSYLSYQDEKMLLIALKCSRDIDIYNNNLQMYPINLISKYEISMGLNRPDNEIQLNID